MKPRATTIEEELRKGRSADEILNDFKFRLKEAQDAFAAQEKKKKECECGRKDLKGLTLDAVREDMVFRVLTYLQMIGVIGEDERIDGKMVEHFVELTKENEERFKLQASLFMLMSMLHRR